MQQVWSRFYVNRRAIDLYSYKADDSILLCILSMLLYINAIFLIVTKGELVKKALQ